MAGTPGSSRSAKTWIAVATIIIIIVLWCQFCGCEGCLPGDYAGPVATPAVEDVEEIEPAIAAAPPIVAVAPAEEAVLPPVAAAPPPQPEVEPTAGEASDSGSVPISALPLVAATAGDSDASEPIDTDQRELEKEPPVPPVGAGPPLVIASATGDPPPPIIGNAVPRFSDPDVASPFGGGKNARPGLQGKDARSMIQPCDLPGSGCQQAFGALAPTPIPAPNNPPVPGPQPPTQPPPF